MGQTVLIYQNEVYLGAMTFRGDYIAELTNLADSSWIVCDDGTLLWISPRAGAVRFTPKVPIETRSTLEASRHV